MLCALLETILSVRVNMIQLSNDQDRFTAERVLRTRPKTYRAIVRLLAEPDAKIERIAKLHCVSTHTVRAIRGREAVAIAERKQRLMSIFANVAELAGERMEELAAQASLRDAGTTAGIATDKLLALTGEASLTIHHLHDHSRPTHQELIQRFNAAMAALGEANERAERRAKAAIVEVPALSDAGQASIGNHPKSQSA